MPADSTPTRDEDAPRPRSTASGRPTNRIGASAACTVYIRFPPSQGPRLQRPEPTTCAHGQPLWTDRPLLLRRVDGTYALIGTTRHLDGLAQWVLSFGAQAEVRSPVRFRRRVAALARRIAHRYTARAESPPDGATDPIRE